MMKERQVEKMNFKKHLCAMNAHYRFYELEDFFRHVHSLGIRYVELWTGPMHYFVDYQKHEDIDKLKELANRYDITIIGICPEQTNPKPNNIAVKQIERKRDVLQYYKQIIDIACELKCVQVLVTSGWGYYSESYEEAWNRSVHMMKQIAAYAEEKHIVLALEALQEDESNLVNTISDIQKYIADVGSKALKVCIDYGAMARAKETVQQYFETFQDDIIHLHFVDGAPCGHLAWGDGDRNLNEDLQVLEKYNYRGFLSLETATSRYYKEPWNAERKTLKMFE